MTKRFYIVTGKGGVGKTTLAWSLAEHLKLQGKNVQLVYFKNTSFEPEKHGQYSKLQSLHVKAKGLELSSCAESYIARKLNSRILAKGVIKTPFFKALVNMLTGFSYLIYLGQILQDLQDNPDLTIVLDSPASGHALTMLESITNFNEIFKSGVVFKDTKKMLEMLYSENFCKVIIVGLAQSMAITEAQELQEDIKSKHELCTQIVINNSLSVIKDIKPTANSFLDMKRQLELSLLEKFPEQPQMIAHSSQHKFEKIIDDLSSQVGALL